MIQTSFINSMWCEQTLYYRKKSRYAHPFLQPNILLASCFRARFGTKILLQKHYLKVIGRKTRMSTNSICSTMYFNTSSKTYKNYVHCSGRDLASVFCALSRLSPWKDQNLALKMNKRTKQKRNDGTNKQRNNRTMEQRNKNWTTEWTNSWKSERLKY